MGIKRPLFASLRRKSTILRPLKTLKRSLLLLDSEESPQLKSQKTNTNTHLTLNRKQDLSMIQEDIVREEHTEYDDN